jgi:hypothetical protein
MLLQHMAMATDKEITTTLTDKQFDGKLKTWNERTTTSPSGVHLGHLKSYYAAHSLDPDTDEGKEITDMQEKLRSAHKYLELLNFALGEGYAFTRWNTIVNTLIPKGAVPHLAYHGSTGALLCYFGIYSTGVQYGALQDPLSKEIEQIGDLCSMFRKIHQCHTHVLLCVHPIQ